MPDESIFPIIFLGIADHIPDKQGPFPINPIDIFQLSKYKKHIVFPISLAGSHWVFLVNDSVFHKGVRERIEIALRSVKDPHLFWQLGISPAVNSGVASQAQHTTESASPHLPNNIQQGSQGSLNIVTSDTGEWLLMAGPLPDFAVVPEPGRFIVEGAIADRKEIIGEVEFLYVPIPPLSLEQMKAIEANPDSVKEIKIVLACRHCQSKLLTYTALNRNPKIEEEGFCWHQDIADTFCCTCGKTKMPLTYMRQNLHALLGRENIKPSGDLDYVRMYAHSRIAQIAKEFNELLRLKTDESSVQKYLDVHPVLFARFHASKLFIKPTILGQFQPDFAVLDTENKLVLIEIEKPGMKLFKANGHLRAELFHAYEQVRDWTHKLERHPAAVIEGLGLKTDEVMAVRGAVIAGRTKNEKSNHLHRHRANSVYDGIEFLTFDDLPASLLEISRKMA